MTVRWTCERFFDGETLHGATVVTLDDGVVVDVAPFDGVPDRALVTPGLVDLQMNGYRDVDAAEAGDESVATLDTHLLDEGTTSWLATIVTAPLDTMAKTLARLSRLRDLGSAPGMEGMHVEGPFLGGAPGAHRVRHIVPVDPTWIESLPPDVRIVTLAAEQQGAVEGVRALVRRGVVASLGHSRPSREQFDDAVGAGASMVTHLFNGMSGVHHRDGGLALWSLTEDSLRLGLIADMVHLDPHVVRLAFASTTADRVCLVSDSIAHESSWAVSNSVTVTGGAPRLPDGTLAGSSTPLSGCVRRAVVDAGVDISRALRAATANPADLLGRPELGRVVSGVTARLVSWDEDLRVVEAVRGLQSARARRPRP